MYYQEQQGKAIRNLALWMLISEQLNLLIYTSVTLTEKRSLEKKETSVKRRVGKNNGAISV